MASKIGAVETALITIFEATSLTKVYRARDAEAIGAAAPPYGVLSVAGGGGVTYDINSRNRVAWPVYLELFCQPDVTGAANVVPNDQLYTLAEELAIVVDSGSNRATLAALPNLIDCWFEDADLHPGGVRGVIIYKLEMDYPY